MYYDFEWWHLLFLIPVISVILFLLNLANPNIAYTYWMGFIDGILVTASVGIIIVGVIYLKSALNKRY